MKDWYYARDNEKIGPVSKEELLNLIEQKVLNENDLVWVEGMDDWQKIKSVPEFKKQQTPKTSNEFHQDSKIFDEHTESFEYAGFWLRTGALIIDIIILSICSVILTSVLFSDVEPEIFESLITFFGLIIGWLYYSLYESSKHQATLGKKAMFIKVTDEKGKKISFGKASGRYFGKFISGLILYIGYLMAAFTNKKQALHDIMAGCLVVKKD